MESELPAAPADSAAVGAEAVSPAIPVEACTPAGPRDDAVGASIPVEALAAAAPADVVTSAVSLTSAATADPAVVADTIQIAYESERRRADALAELNRAKTTFFAHLSEEFREPLTLILGPAGDLLSGDDGRLSERQRTQIATIRRNGVHLLKLVDTLLTFARIEAGHVDATFEPTDLAAFTTELASVFRSAFERGGLELGVDCTTVDQPVYVDRDMWEKVVLNLLSNALKFTFEGRVDVTVRAIDDHAELVVSDTGVGISEEDLPHLFTRFHRIHGVLARSKEGSGVGLALVHELVRIHGGTTSVTSQAGKGTTFTVRLPMGRAHLPPDRIKEQTQAPSVHSAAAFIEDAARWLPENEAAEPVVARETQADLGPIAFQAPQPRVLIADDHADIRAYLCRLLGRSCTVEAVPDGQTALAAARARRPDIVIADVMMHGLDGFALTRALRANAETATIPVVLCSGRASEESRLEGLKAGAADYLVKPFSGRELVAKVQGHLERARLRAQADRERARLRALFTESPIPICIVRGPDHVYEFTNPPYAGLVGGREVIGLTAREALPELEGQGFFESLDSVYRTGKTYWAVETPLHLIRVEGQPSEESCFNVVYQAMRGPGDEVEAVMVFALDVTEQVRVRRRIEEDIRDREAFVAAASHELRNPIHALQVQLQTILRVAERETQTSELGWVRERVGRAASEVSRLARLLDSLLEASRLTSGRFPLVLEELELGDIVAEVLDRLDPARQALIVTRVWPARGRWDRARLDQVITNLVSNALKYGEGRPVEILVAASESGARLDVTDHGIGIAAEHQTRIFDRFERAVTNARYSGFGLGLWITSRIVEELGGTLSVQSELGEGSTFTVELPKTPRLHR